MDQTATIYLVADAAAFDEAMDQAASSANAAAADITSSFDEAGGSVAASSSEMANTFDESMARTAEAADAAGASVDESFATASTGAAAAADEISAAGLAAGAGMRDGVADGADGMVDDVGTAAQDAGDALKEGVTSSTADMADDLADAGLLAGTQMGGKVEEGAEDLSANLGKTGESAGDNLATGLAAGSKKAKTPLSDVGKWALLGAAGVAAASAKMAIDWQESMTSLVTGAGQSKAGLDAVSQGLLSMAGQTATSTSQLAQGMYMVESAGYHGSQGLDVLKASAEGAKVGSAALATVANVVTSALNAYGLKGKTATSVTNELVATVASGKMHMQTLATAISNVLPVAASAKISFATVGGAIATMTAQGVTARRASMNLAAMLRALIAPSAGAAAEMQKLGLTANDLATHLGSTGITGTLNQMTEALLKNTQGGTIMATGFSQMTPAAQGVAEAILSGKASVTQIDTAMKTLTPTQAKMVSNFQSQATSATGLGQTWDAAMKTMVGGATGLNVALLLSGTHAKTFGDNVKSVGSAATAAGNTVKGFSTVQHDLGFQLDSTKDSAEALGISFGEALLPKLEGALHAGEDVVNWLDQNKTVAEALAAVVGGVLAVAVGVYAVNKVTAFVSSIQKAWTSLTTLGTKVQTAATKLFGLGAPADAAAESQAAMGSASEVAAGQIATSATGAQTSIEGLSSTTSGVEASVTSSFEGMATSASGAASEIAGAASGVDASAAGMEGSVAGMGEEAAVAGGAEGLGAVAEGASSMLGPIGLAAGLIAGPLIGAFGSLLHSGPTAAKLTAQAVTALNKKISAMPTSTVLQMGTDLLTMATETNKAVAAYQKLAAGSAGASVAAGKIQDLTTKSIEMARQAATMQGNVAGLGAAFGLTATQVQQLATAAGVTLKQAMNPGLVDQFKTAMRQSGTATEVAAAKTSAASATISKAIEGQVNTAKAQYPQLSDAAKTAMELDIALMQRTGAAAIAALVNSTKGGLPDVEAAAEQYGVTIPHKYMTELQTALTSGGRISIEKLTTQLQNLGGYHGSFTSMEGVANESLSQIATDMAHGGFTMMTKLVAAVNKAGPTLSTTTTATVLNAVQAVEKHKTDLGPTGTGLVAGLVKAIEAGTASAINAAVQLVTSAINAANAKAGVKSPSTVMYATGGYMVAGLVNALHDGTATATSAAHDLMSAVLDETTVAASFGAGRAAGQIAGPSAAPAGGLSVTGGAATGLSIGTISITITAPTGTPAKLARELAPAIRTELLQLQRSLGGPVRSTVGVGLVG